MIFTVQIELNSFFIVKFRFSNPIGLDKILNQKSKCSSLCVIVTTKAY